VVQTPLNSSIFAIVERALGFMTGKERPIFCKNLVLSPRNPENHLDRDAQLRRVRLEMNHAGAAPIVDDDCISLYLNKFKGGAVARRSGVEESKHPWGPSSILIFRRRCIALLLAMSWTSVGTRRSTAHWDINRMSLTCLNPSYPLMSIWKSDARGGTSDERGKLAGQTPRSFCYG